MYLCTLSMIICVSKRERGGVGGRRERGEGGGGIQSKKEGLGLSLHLTVEGGDTMYIDIEPDPRR